MTIFALLCASILVWSAPSSAVVNLRHGARPSRRTGHEPILMVSHGCSGTTGGYKVLRELLTDAVNESMAETGNGEVLRYLDRVSTKAEIYEQMWGNYEELHESILNQDKLLERFKILYEKTQSEGKTLAFKVQLDTAMDNEDLMDFIIEHNPRPFLFRRRNLLDVMHCRVIDFCGKDESVSDLGNPVDETGNLTCEEFRGREGASTREGESLRNVYLYPDRLVENLDKQAEQDFFHWWYLKNKELGDFEVFGAEDLFLFEYDDSEAALTQSATKWKALLDSIGSYAGSVETIKRVLRTYPSFPPPKKHQAIFWNFGHIKEVLRGTKYEHMLRL